MKTFKDKETGVEKAAVTKEDMKKKGFTSFGKESLRRYLMGKGPKKKEPGAMSEPMGMAKKGGIIKKAKRGGKLSEGVKLVARQYGGKIGY